METTATTPIYPNAREAICPFCGKQRKLFSGIIPGVTRYKPCNCEGWINNQRTLSEIEEEEARKRKARAAIDRARKLHSESGLLDFDLTFDSETIGGYPAIIDDNNEEQLCSARFFASHFPSAGRFLYLTGNPGTGKTVVACMAGNQLLRAGMRVEYFSCVDIMRSVTPHLQSSSSDKLKAQARREGLLNSPIIILDDPGKADWTAALRRLMYSVIDKREKNKNQGIVIAAKEPFAEFTEYFGDWQREIARRLLNMTGNYGGAFELTGNPIVNGLREEAGGMY